MYYDLCRQLNMLIAHFVTSYRLMFKLDSLLSMHVCLLKFMCTLDMTRKSNRDDIFIINMRRFDEEVMIRSMQYIDIQKT